MVCIATIVSVVVVNLARNQHATPLPWVIKNLLTGWLGHILGLGHIIAQVMDSQILHSYYSVSGGCESGEEPACHATALGHQESSHRVAWTHPGTGSPHSAGNGFTNIT